MHAALSLPVEPQQSATATQPTGILALDIRAGLSEPSKPGSRASLLFPEEIEGSSRHKSIWLAGGLSALVPGTGQIYAEAPLWRTLLYGAAEVAGWTFYGLYNSKGKQATIDFELFANRHWSVTRYVSWIENNYTGWSDADVDKQAASEALAEIYLSDDVSLPPWERIDFEQLTKLEQAVKGGFSHTLPNHGAQQYYEQIGKYIQYRAGWDDHRSDGDTLIFDPSRVTARNREYVASRERANDLLGYAGSALWVLALNHVVSAVDAMLAARSYNISVRTDIKGEILPDGSTSYARSIGMTIRF